jgi:hypothetical protein
LPKTPGLGFDFDAQAVRKYALNQQEAWSTAK